VNRGLTDAALFAGLFLLLSGFWLTAGMGADSSTQVVRTLHVVAGLVLLLPLVAGTVAHVRTRLLLRPDSMDNAARLNGIVLIAVVLSGLGLLAGSFYWSAANAALSIAHLASAIVLVPVTLWHVRAALRRHTGRRAAGTVDRRRGLPHVGLALLVLLVGVAIGLWLEAARTAPSTAYLPETGESSPFLPARTLSHGNQYIDASRLARSEECAACHPDIFEQWSESMHRASSTDPHVATGIDWFRRDNGVEASRICAGCHDPIPLLAGELEAKFAAMTDRAPAHPEGVSCLVCHSIDSVPRDMPGNGSYRIKEPSPSILGTGTLGKAMLQASRTSHSEAVMRRPLFQDPSFCASCHQQLDFASKAPFDEEDISGQFHEWKLSPFAEKGSEDFKTCQDCHMPLVEAKDPAARDGKVHSHRFVGSNHAHAAAAGLKEQADLVLENLRRGVLMELHLAEIQAKPGFLVVEVPVTNRGSGHEFPTGVTDIKEAWIELVAESGGEQLLASGLLDERHYLDPDAHSWRKVLLDHRNLPVDLHNMAVVKKTLLERTILPSATDIARYEIPLVGRQSGSVTIRARLRMRRANQRWNDWLFNFDGRTMPVVDIYSRTLAQDIAAITWHEAAPEKAESPVASTGKAAAPEGMVYIPAGPALLGDPEGEPDEQPAKTLQVDGFAIDRYPVTNLQYQKFLEAMGNHGPVLKLPWAGRYNWVGKQFPDGTARQPAILVTRDEAEAYCRWRGGMALPTEAEWEKAARGPQGYRYPWGNDWDKGRCPEVAGMDVPTSVGMCTQRDSAYGVSDLLGGVFEWTADSYSAYDRTFLHPNANEWLVTFDPLMYSVRGAPPGQQGPATAAYSRSGQNGYQRGRVGFRCVQNGASL